MTLTGIDVSGIGQGATFDWAAWRGKIAFAFAKASEGTGFRDPDFGRNWPAMKADGLIRGAYHFITPTVSGAAQADFFLSVVNPAPGDLLMMDHETPGVLGPTGPSGVAVEFADRVRVQTGAWPVCYTDESMAQGGYCAGLGQCPLFLANPDALPVPKPIGPWSLVSFEQHRAVLGVDQDMFYGTADQLRRLTVLHAVPRPVPVLHSWRLEWPATTAKPELVSQVSTDGGTNWH